MICKIQRPLHTTMKNPQALIYNQDRSVELMVPFNNVAALFNKGQLKVYYECHINDDSKLVIESPVTDQEW